jgi:hypothetical protein
MDSGWGISGASSGRPLRSRLVAAQSCAARLPGIAFTVLVLELRSTSQSRQGSRFGIEGSGWS